MAGRLRGGGLPGTSSEGSGGGGGGGTKPEAPDGGTKPEAPDKICAQIKASGNERFQQQVRQARADVREISSVAGWPVAIASLFGQMKTAAAVVALYALPAYVFAEDVVAMHNLPDNINAVLSMGNRPTCP